MRELMLLVESKLPEEVYHGTSMEHWAPDYGDPSEFYLAVNYETAKGYALEWAEEGEIPIVVVFKLRDLMNLGHAKLEPNWEYVQMEAEDLGKNAADIEGEYPWTRTLEEVGTFCIQGFTDLDKRLGFISRV